MLEQDPETSGLLDKCQQLGVTLVAHSPLQQGILTGTALLLVWTSVCLVAFCRLITSTMYLTSGLHCTLLHDAGGACTAVGTEHL